MRRPSLVLLAALLTCGAQASVAYGALRFADEGEVRSVYEGRRGAAVDRDCGYSRLLPGRTEAIWLFCDSKVRRPDGVRYLLGSSGATTAGRASVRLRELPSPPVSDGDGAPAPFFALPTGLRRANGRVCAPGRTHYPVAWTTGLAVEPDSGHLLMPYVRHCVDGLSRRNYLPQSFGMAEYDPVTNRFVRDEPRLRTQRGLVHPLRQLGSPVVRGRRMYLFSSVCTRFVFGGCTRGRVAATRVDLTPTAGDAQPWFTPGRYRSWSGRGWTRRDPTRAASILRGARPAAISVDVDPASGRLVLVESTDVDGGVRIWSARSPRGPWRRVGSGTLPGCTVGKLRNDFCRAVIPHMELGSRRRLVLSYYRPATRHLQLVSTRW